MRSVSLTSNSALSRFWRRDRDVGLRRDPLALDLLLELAHVLFGVGDREDEVLGLEARAQLVALDLEAGPLERLLRFVELALRRRHAPPLFGFGPLDLRVGLLQLRLLGFERALLHAWDRR